MSFKPSIHPVLGLPTAREAVAMGEAAWREAMVRRELIIKREKDDPFGQGWEPPVWQLADALMGLPWMERLPDEVQSAECKVQSVGERIRERLGFNKPARVMLILGGNRAGKSQWASKRLMRILRMKSQARAWALHSTLPMSRQYQQPLLYDYLPAGLRGSDIKGRTTYVAYKQKTGFSEEQFVLPPMNAGERGSDCLFKTYDQDVASIEGGNLDIIWPDELVPNSWVETMELRIAEKNGWMPVTFTPVEGYTPTVSMFLDGAEVVLESVAFLCPKDGGPPDVARALGFDDLLDGTTAEDQLLEVQAAEQEGRASLYPQCVPQSFDLLQQDKGSPSPLTPLPQERRIAGRAGPVVGWGQPKVPEGREFETVPRLMRCADEEGKRAVLFFHSSDNPYGNPKNVWATIAGRNRDYIKERFYGVAHRTLSVRFTKFDRYVHVIAPDQIPKEGTNYQFADPCSGRNFFMSWFRVTPGPSRTGLRVYLYREWPSGYYIPALGEVPGPWAVPDGRHPDGRRGPAQKPFGWGLRRYKQEIARLEGWKVLDKPKPDELSEEEWVDSWSEHEGARETIKDRYIDSRFASTPKVVKGPVQSQPVDRPVTLLTDLEDIGLYFMPTPGNDIDEGAELITDALDYDDKREVDYFNQPSLLVSSECVNTIYALQTWTGMTREGRRCLDGASKDPIDLLRYFFLSDCPYLGGKEEEDPPSSEALWRAGEGVVRRWY